MAAIRVQFVLSARLFNAPAGTEVLASIDGFR